MSPRPLAALAALLILSACGTPWGVPPDRQPDRAGAVPAAAAPLSEGAARARAFLEVAARVEPVAERDCAIRNPGANCDFRIVVDDRPGLPANAFQALDRSGRPILAFTGALIASVENSDELALVMAHEASHHIAGHLARQDQYATMGAAVLGQIASQTAGATPAMIRDARMLGAELGARSYSKEFELEADRLGAMVAARAGFDPVRGSLFFLRLPDPGDRFLGTHPSNGERMAVVAQAAREMGL
ncbi:M48 family metallopeptidase [Rubellimicrobium aerolatum]|uniref:M48 family metallopeptidase n=1 Tax=Rubellimicrobium aerolatum TaxID=490979 RepID=A0ABW0SEI9_9RHOB|nr:M48 family metallopeptidase [Rubellimicrobium aerolatum]MBP1805678.1 putative Zn-dependent protease [Rubellimicrobium aerolatum]